jgi:hypothetical protein
MQLDARKSIRATVSAITATLLGSSAAGADSNLDSSLLIYSEKGRVTVSEGLFSFLHKFSERRSVGLKLTLDALTGASPNGATPASTPQTFTSPSGGSSYTTPAGEIPLDNTFQDQRIALDGTLIESLDRITFLNVGGHLSLEHDYTSLGLNGRLTRDFNRRNTTLGVSASYNYDIVRPLGGAPVPLASMPPPGENEGEDEGEGEDGEEGGAIFSGEGKNVLNLVVGVTQVVDRKTVVRMDYSAHRSSGYLNDPYKIVSVVQDANSAAPGEPADYIFESRPDTRLKQALYGEMRRYVAGSTVNVSYRYFWDDWEINSHTADFSVWMPVGKKGHAVEPHYRWYRQSEANFHNYYLLQGHTLPSHASADSRLAEFDAHTFGLRYVFPLGGGNLSLTGEYYTQNSKRGPPNAVGILSQYNLFPPMDVYMARVGYSHGF